MDRRHVLATGIASLLAGCGGADPGSFENAETKWPPEGDLIPTSLGRIHAWDKGSGTPVILIHGASGNLRDFTWKIGPDIAKSRRAIAMDRPGMGYSDRVEPNGGDPAVQARALMAAAAEMGLKEPILLGHSWGAAVATSWAMQDRENVKGVVTVSGTVMPWFEKKSFAELGHGRGDFPLAEAAADELVSLPMYPELPTRHLDRVVELLLEWDADHEHA